VLGIVVSIVAAAGALAVGYARWRRARSGPSPRADALARRLRTEPFAARATAAVDETDPDSWEGGLAREVLAAATPDERASVIDDRLAELQGRFEGSAAWDRVVTRLALLGGVLAASVVIIDDGLTVFALVPAGIGAAAALGGAAVVRAARAAEMRQRDRADELAALFAGGPPARGVRHEEPVRAGLDRRRGRR
jgi:hypothetical protein